MVCLCVKLTGKANDLHNMFIVCMYSFLFYISLFFPDAYLGKPEDGAKGPGPGPTGRDSAISWLPVESEQGQREK